MNDNGLINDLYIFFSFLSVEMFILILDYYARLVSEMIVVEISL